MHHCCHPLNKIEKIDHMLDTPVHTLYKRLGNVQPKLHLSLGAYGGDLRRVPANTGCPVKWA